jgi:hypothetical protein
MLTLPAVIGAAIIAVVLTSVSGLLPPGEAAGAEDSALVARRRLFDRSCGPMLGLSRSGAARWPRDIGAQFEGVEDVRERRGRRQIL